MPVLPAPTSASEMLDREVARWRDMERRGRLLTGCDEVDGHVLLGGLGRGEVVGVSCEDEDVGLLIGLQIVSHLLVAGHEERPGPRVMIVTTLATSSLLPRLREVLVGQVDAVEGGPKDVRMVLQRCFERVSIARVFDFEGLWEVLMELGSAGREEEGQEDVPDTEKGEQREPDNLHDHIGDGIRPTPQLDESEPESLPKLQPSFEPGPTVQAQHTPATETAGSAPPKPRKQSHPALPDIILITHTSTLLNTLFTADKPTAHDRTLALSTKLHHLTRSPSHGNPLIMLINATTTTTTTTSTAPTTTDPELQDNQPPPRPYPTEPDGFFSSRTPKTDQTLRSIFTFSPVTSKRGIQVTKQTRPSFGLVFAQLLDVHLLCTRVPRNMKRDGRDDDGVARGWVWVVEVLLDETGVYDCDDEKGLIRRRSREQRWAGVDVEVGNGGGKRRVVGCSF
ncbi:hypothetical protein QBC47DRAFT_310239 [Echria macrotheca]|uniref:Uncharacterized protein n=1 Tax=Echria macrotheca TaxID=438768 RepID=A0AAJ0B259_9PEZI|nr:hypothetical protein QBC47DRAFT_310239 [Echria macrotheca]